MWPPNDETMERPVIQRVHDPQELLALIIESVNTKDTRSLKTYILEHKLKEESIVWELILKIGDCITTENFEQHSGFFEVCVRCLTYLVKTGKPKETLLAVLEQMDTFIDDTKYKTFLPLIQTALLNIPRKLFHSLDIALETVSAHIRGINPPENTQLEGREIKLFHTDKTVVRLTDVLDAFLDFLEPFIPLKATSYETCIKADRQMSHVLKKHLLRILEHPLCYLILTFSADTDKAESNSRLCAERTMRMLAQVETDFHKLLQDTQDSLCVENSNNEEKMCLDDGEEMDNRENELKEKSEVRDIVENWNFKLDFSPLGQACLIYLIHVEQLGLEKFPFIYSHQYIFESHLGSMSLLLQNVNFVVNFKGLLLCRALVDLLLPSSLTADNLDNPGYFTMFNDLIHIMLKCPVSDHRSLATKIFPSFLDRFTPEGRYQIYHTLLVSCSHSSLKGYLITLLKNDIGKNVKLLKVINDKMSSKTVGIEPSVNSFNWVKPSLSFMGNSLRRLLHLVLRLPEGETTDMLENSNQIISALNMLRFLFIADPRSSNLSQVWDSIKEIETIFLCPLRTGLDLSKAHYKLELDTVLGRAGSLTGTSQKASSSSTPEMNVAVEGQTLPALEKSEKADLIHKAINTHDIMLSLLARVTEIVDLAADGV